MNSKCCFELSSDDSSPKSTHANEAKRLEYEIDDSSFYDSSEVHQDEIQALTGDSFNVHSRSAFVNASAQLETRQSLNAELSSGSWNSGNCPTCAVLPSEMINVNESNTKPSDSTQTQTTCIPAVHETVNEVGNDSDWPSQVKAAFEHVQRKQTTTLFNLEDSDADTSELLTVQDTRGDVMHEEISNGKIERYNICRNYILATNESANNHEDSRLLTYSTSPINVSTADGKNSWTIPSDSPDLLTPLVQYSEIFHLSSSPSDETDSAPLTDLPDEARRMEIAVSVDALTSDGLVSDKSPNGSLSNLTFGDQIPKESDQSFPCISTSSSEESAGRSADEELRKYCLYVFSSDSASPSKCQNETAEDVDEENFFSLPTCELDAVTNAEKASQSSRSMYDGGDAVISIFSEENLSEISRLFDSDSSLNMSNRANHFLSTTSSKQELCLDNSSNDSHGSSVDLCASEKTMTSSVWQKIYKDVECPLSDTSESSSKSRQLVGSTACSLKTNASIILSRKSSLMNSHSLASLGMEFQQDSTICTDSEFSLRDSIVNKVYPISSDSEEDTKGPPSLQLMLSLSGLSDTSSELLPYESSDGLTVVTNSLLSEDSSCISKSPLDVDLTLLVDNNSLDDASSFKMTALAAPNLTDACNHLSSPLSDCESNPKCLTLHQNSLLFAHTHEVNNLISSNCELKTISPHDFHATAVSLPATGKVAAHEYRCEKNKEAPSPDSTSRTRSGIITPIQDFSTHVSSIEDPFKSEGKENTANTSSSSCSYPQLSFVIISKYRNLKHDCNNPIVFLDDFSCTSVSTQICRLQAEKNSPSPVRLKEKDEVSTKSSASSHTKPTQLGSNTTEYGKDSSPTESAVEELTQRHQQCLATVSFLESKTDRLSTMSVHDTEKSMDCPTLKSQKDISPASRNSSVSQLMHVQIKSINKPSSKKRNMAKRPNDILLTYEKFISVLMKSFKILSASHSVITSTDGKFDKTEREKHRQFLVKLSDFLETEFDNLSLIKLREQYKGRTLDSELHQYESMIRRVELLVENMRRILNFLINLDSAPLSSMRASESQKESKRKLVRKTNSSFSAKATKTSLSQGQNLNNARRYGRCCCDICKQGCKQFNVVRLSTLRKKFGLNLPPWSFLRTV